MQRQLKRKIRKAKVSNWKASYNWQEMLRIRRSAANIQDRNERLEKLDLQLSGEGELLMEDIQKTELLSALVVKSTKK